MPLFINKHYRKKTVVGEAVHFEGAWPMKTVLSSVFLMQITLEGNPSL